jgi:hypothetical protein
MPNLDMEALVFTALAAALAVLYWIGARRAHRALADRFANRPTLDFSSFYQIHYAGKLDRETVEQLLAHVAQELSIPANKLRPSDRFDVELKPARGWEFDSGKGILLVELHKLARAKGKSIDTKLVVTLDDYLLAMAEIW